MQGFSYTRNVKKIEVQAIFVAIMKFSLQTILILLSLHCIYIVRCHRTTIMKSFFKHLHLLLTVQGH